LEEEMQSTKQELIAEKFEYPGFSSNFSGRALCLKIKSDKLDHISKFLRECTWQRNTRNDAHFDIFHHCDALIESIEMQITDLYRKWLAELGDNPKSRLDRCLMRRSTDYNYDKNNQQLECNIDPQLVSLCAEADYWLDLKFLLPKNVQVISGRWSSLQFIYENVLAIVGAYNNIIQGKSVFPNFH
jgi:dynein heavy chain